ncbi:hypothetical protein CSX12_13865 [Microbacterium sp. Y-01]|uniref:hypothetical protein n=1 Tax=Microbacterium sp. Y-01 TaxID=2048898 RepID=UPI000F5F740E|nr:hypothetical protein [Microbacterium sp. Y-01]AZH79446.1 hypothetical protein CSX12_13865 [Microbacterium sp. Y-01]
MARKHYENEVVRLADLAVTSDTIEGVTFRDCLVLGPAIVIPMSETSITNGVFTGDPEALFWELNPARELVIGAIGLVSCEFDGCRFERVGFAGGVDVLHALGGAERADP